MNAFEKTARINKNGEACEIQYDGLNLKIEKTKVKNELVFVVIGRKNFYNEQEFIEKLKSIQTQ